MRRRRFNQLPTFLRGEPGTTRSINDDDLGSYRPLLAIWLIQMALTFEWYRKPRPTELPNILSTGEYFGTLTGIEYKEAARTADDDDLSPKAIRRITNASIEQKLHESLAKWKKEPLTGDLTLLQNIEMLGEALSLSETDLAVLTYALVLKSFPIIERIVTHQNQSVSNRQLAKLIEALTGQTTSKVLESLRSDSRLVMSGLIKIERSNADLENKLDVMDSLTGTMLTPHKSRQELTAHFLRLASTPSLELSAYPHLQQDITTLKDYLAGACKSGRNGINILFYGPPGTGKTELAKALAQSIGQTLYEIDFSDEDGDPIKGDARLRAYNFVQKLLEGNSQAMLMFDEIEDVIASKGGFFEMLTGMSGEHGNNKAWINRTMERNPVPTIWVTNNERIDLAYRRRFDYSVYFPVPPAAVRVEIARYHLGSIAPNEEWLQKIAGNESVSPSQYERMAKVAEVIGGETPFRVAEQTLDRSMRLMGQKRQPARNTRYTGYSMDFINTELDLKRLISGLSVRPHASICLYGPPGTGKSEFAHHLADCLHLPVIARRASDLLDMYLGGTEANIANMFMEAREQNAVLLLDEADSFLQDRRGAHRSWEVTQVNELLTQMEAFDGIFICTTNLMANLDQASLRRFSVKAKFDFLASDQRWAMFCAELGRLGGEPAPGLESQVRKLGHITPGDFAVASRQFKLWGNRVTAQELLDALRQEAAVKEHGKSIGFVS